MKIDKNFEIFSPFYNEEIYSIKKAMDCNNEIEISIINNGKIINGYRISCKNKKDRNIYFNISRIVFYRIKIKEKFKIKKLIKNKNV